MNKLLTVKEAADQLGTSVRFIRRLIAERRIAYAKLGRHIRIAPADLDAFVAGGRVEAGSSPGSTQRRSA
jgi:excisionase family DNA binding protein